MARPSKLAAWQWADIRRRLLAGERAADLARSYGVSKSAVSERLATRIETVRRVASQLFEAEQALRALVPDEQLAALRMAETMRVEIEAERIAVRAISIRLWSK